MKIVNEANFEEEIKEGLVLVDFFANWCGPCRMMSVILEDFTDETDAKILKVDVDESEALARRFGVMSIPTLILFKDGKQVYKHIGLMQKEALKKLIKENN